MIKTHYGDPCIHCGIGHDDVPSGDCRGDPEKAVPISWCGMGVRWDNVEHYRIRYSDNRIEDRWEHVSFHLPNYQFGRSKNFGPSLPWDDRLRVASP